MGREGSGRDAGRRIWMRRAEREGGVPRCGDGKRRAGTDESSAMFQFWFVFLGQSEAEESGSDSDDGAEPGRKRRRVTEEVLERRRQRRLWEERRYVHVYVSTGTSTST